MTTQPDPRDPIKLLAARIPALRAELDGLAREWGKELPGAHIVYGDVVVPYLRRLLQSSEASAEVAAVFALLEELLAREEQPLTDLVGASVLEGLNDDKAILSEARRHMGPRTLRLAQQVEDAWG
jgi:hypothetical protein